MALRYKPDFAEVYNSLGSALALQGRMDEAVQHYCLALSIKPDYAVAHDNLHKIFAEAMKHYREVLRSEPDNAAAANNLAWLLATCPVASLRQGAEAVEIAQHANRVSGGNQPAVLDTLAAAYAEAGRFSEAVQTARKAQKLAAQRNKLALADVLSTRITLYEAGKPFQQPPAAADTSNPE